MRPALPRLASVVKIAEPVRLQPWANICAHNQPVVLVRGDVVLVRGDRRGRDPFDDFDAALQVHFACPYTCLLVKLCPH